MLDMIDFCERLGSTNPTPGGGAAAALTLALAAGAAEKAGRFSVQDSSEHKKFVEIFSEIRINGIKLSTEDQTAFAGWQEARKLPKSSDEEKKIRTERINFFVSECSRVPFDICKNALSLIKAISNFTPFCNKHLVSDAGVGGYLALAAFEAGKINIEINKPYLKDDKMIKEIDIFFEKESAFIKKETESIAIICDKMLKA